MLLLFKGLRSREDTPGGHISLYLLAATCSLIGERMSYPYRAVRDVVGDGMDAPRDKDSGGEVSFALSAHSKIERAFPLSDPASQTYSSIACTFLFHQQHPQSHQGSTALCHSL